MNDIDISTLRVKLGELYDIADKNLSQSKEDMIISDIKDYSFDYVFNKIKAVKQAVISGQKFDTALVYRYLGFKETKKQEKPLECDKCDDGYILAVIENREIGFACNCELGKFRNRSEKMSYYKEQELSDNFKLKYGVADIDISNIRKAKKYIQENPVIIEEEKCPF